MTGDGRRWDAIFADPQRAVKAEGGYFYQMVLDRIAPGDTICDVGCGAAFHLPGLLRCCGSGGSYIGVDFSAVALSLARATCGGAPNVQFVRADMRALPLREHCADRVLCSESLPYLLDDVERGLSELARIARGELVFSLHTPAAYQIAGAAIERRGNVVSEHTAGAKPPRRVFEVDEIEALVAATGTLRIDTMIALRWGELYETPAGAQWPWFLPARNRVALYCVIAKRM